MGLGTHIHTLVHVHSPPADESVVVIGKVVEDCTHRPQTGVGEELGRESQHLWWEAVRSS